MTDWLLTLSQSSFKKSSFMDWTQSTIKIILNATDTDWAAESGQGNQMHGYYWVLWAKENGLNFGGEKRGDKTCFASQIGIIRTNSSFSSCPNVASIHRHTDRYFGGQPIFLTGNQKWIFARHCSFKNKIHQLYSAHCNPPKKFKCNRYYSNLSLIIKQITLNGDIWSEISSLICNEGKFDKNKEAGGAHNSSLSMEINILAPLNIMMFLTSWKAYIHFLIMQCVFFPLCFSLIMPLKDQSNILLVSFGAYNV